MRHVITIIIIIEACILQAFLNLHS